jgi:hypothetical protein
MNLKERRFIINLPNGTDFVVDDVSKEIPFWDCVDILLLHENVLVIQNCIIKLLDKPLIDPDANDLKLLYLREDEKASKKLEQVFTNIFLLGDNKNQQADLVRYLGLSKSVLSFVSPDKLIKWIIDIYEGEKNLPNYLDSLAQNISETRVTEPLIVLGLFTASVMKKKEVTVRLVDEWMQKILILQNATFVGIKFLQGIPDIREDLSIGYWGTLSDIQDKSGLPISNDKKLLLWQILIERELKNDRNPYRWLKEEDIKYVKTNKDIAHQLLEKYIELPDFETLQKMVKDGVASIKDLDEVPIESINFWLASVVIGKFDIQPDEVDFYFSFVERCFRLENLSKELYALLFAPALYEKKKEQVSSLFKKFPYDYEMLGDTQYISDPDSHLLLMLHISEQNSEAKISDLDFDFLWSIKRRENP